MKYNKYKTDAERAIARGQQIQARLARRKIQRQQQAGILPMWKAEVIIDLAMEQGGASFDEAYNALVDVIQSKGLRLRAGTR